MRNLYFLRLAFAAVTSLYCVAGARATDGDSQGRLENVVGAAVRPLMKEHRIPGMAVAVTVEGKQYFFNYGVASKETGQKVTQETIFEIGSTSKAFTATLASYAEALGKLSLSDKASKYLPVLSGTGFDTISLLQLGTYTAGGLPLQFPKGVTDPQEMVDFYRGWRPTYAAGTYRLYSNPSIGLFGHLAARSMGAPFDELMEKQLFPALGLRSTYIRVPHDRMGKYAYGYSKADKPVRVTPGMLDAEAYGVKTTSADLIRFVEANMRGEGIDATLKGAIAATHAGYFKVGEMTQALGWEKYPYPVALDRLLSGNSADMAFKPQGAETLDPSREEARPELINKTGSTNGFGAYVAFVPTENIGIVLLANRNYPIPARIKAAHRILKALDEQAATTGNP